MILLQVKAAKLKKCITESEFLCRDGRSIINLINRIKYNHYEY
jgi:hypothetical protein